MDVTIFDTFVETVKKAPRFSGRSCCAFHELDILNALHCDAVVYGQRIRVVLDVKEDLRNLAVFQDSSRVLVLGSASIKCYAIKRGHIDGYDIHLRCYDIDSKGQDGDDFFTAQVDTLDIDIEECWLISPFRMHMGDPIDGIGQPFGSVQDSTGITLVMAI